MKLALQRRIPRDYNPQIFTDIARDIERAVNLLVEERLTGHDGALTTAPTTNEWAKGDFVRNSNPAEAGSVASKYVIFGWVCTTAGTPGTWKECRFLTGN